VAHPVDVDELKALGLTAGLDAVGVASAEPFERARETLRARKSLGLHAGMAFTYKNPDRSTNPAGLVRGARAIVVGARRHPVANASRPAGGPFGRVARYARADHYAPLRQALRAVARQLHTAGWKAVVFADDNSMVDREAAYRAGLGWYGKSSNLLLPGQGSWFVLGSVVTDAPLPPDAAPVDDGCGTCRRCLDGCPTGAIIAPGVVDANRCLAWLAQRSGEVPREYRVALGDRIYGCDDCQEVCPPNRRLEAAPVGGLGDAARDTDDAGDTDRDGPAWVDLLSLLAADDAELLDRFGRWYLADRDPRWLRRNALVALGNVADPSDERVSAVLRQYLLHDDAVLRAHAAWAAARLGLGELLALVADDPDPQVRFEVALSLA
jgi:epoxyqueuosine reductase